MANNSDYIRRAVNQLGYFTGDISEHQFVARLLNLATATGDSIDPSSDAGALEAIETEVDVSADNGLEAVIGALIGMSDGGTFISQFVSILKDFVAGADTDNQIVKRLTEAVDDDGTGGRLFTVHSETLHGPGTEFCGYYPISALCNIVPGGMPINSTPDAPTKTTPNIGIVNFHNPALNFANRSSGLCGIFLNLLPTIEISKCQPFVDIKLITEAAPTNDFDGVKKIGDGISLLRFLNGKTTVDADDPFPIAQPIGIGLYSEPKKRDDGTPEYDENGQPIMVTKPATVAGMEVFTSPQTLVNGNEPHYDIGPRRRTPEGRQASVIDKFRPFMTLESFEVKVVPARGMISTKSASISMVLHDRSRLAEIGQLVKPDGLANIEILAEYGWSHPEGIGSDNAFATMLNAMRVKEKFQVVNSSMSFDDVGQAKISLSLVSKGNNDLTFRMVTDREVAQMFDKINVLFKEIREIKKRIRGDLVENEEMIGSQVMGKANSMSAIMSMSDEDMKELEKVIKQIKNNPRLGDDYEDLAKKMQDGLVAAENLESKVQSAMKKKVDAVGKGADPFIKPCAAQGIRSVRLSARETGNIEARRCKGYSSFARIALEFIAKPMAATGKFDEIQMCFYPINQYATFARDDDVGSFPINLKHFKKEFNNKIKKNPNLTLAAFMGFMNSSFFNNMSSDIYGFGSIYERDPDTGKAKIRKKFEESKEKSQKMASERKKVFEAAYGPGAEQKFKKPSVQMYLETVPGANTDSGGDNATILRIHFFDQTATSYSGFAEMWESLRSGLSSAINTTAVAAFRARENPPDADSGQQINLSNYAEHFGAQMAALAKLDIIEAVDGDGNAVPISDLTPALDAASGNTTDTATLDQILATRDIKYVRIKGGPAGLKYLFHRNMPSIKYGSQYSAVIKANLSTQQDNRMATIHMQRNKNDTGSGPDAGTDDGLPLTTFPG